MELLDLLDTLCDLAEAVQRLSYGLRAVLNVAARVGGWLRG